MATSSQQEVHGEAEDGQGHDGDEGKDDDPGHSDRSPFEVGLVCGRGLAGAVLAAGDPGCGDRLVVAVLGDQQPGGDVEGHADTGEQG